MPTQRNELRLLKEAAMMASVRLLPDATDTEIHLVLRVLAERVNDGLDAAESASIAVAVADDDILGVPIVLIGERVIRYRHYTLRVGGEEVAHWIRRTEELLD